MAVEEGDAALEKLGVPAVVVVQERHVRRRGGADEARCVVRGAAVLARPHQPHARVFEVRLHDGIDLRAAGPVLRHREAPAGEGLTEHGLDRFGEVGRRPMCWDADVDHRRDSARSIVVGRGHPA